MGGSPPPGSKKGGYKPVVRSCVEKHQRVALNALLHVRSPYITQAVDILWLGHMLCEQYYSPPEKPFKMELELLDIEKAEA